MRKAGFTLVELIVVVMIIGLLVGIAMPRVIQISAEATDNGLRQTLSVVRDAIEKYKAQHGGALPGANGNPGTFKKDLAPYLGGPFPTCPVGAKDDRVRMLNSTGISGVASPGRAWRYSYISGEFIVNYNQPTMSDPAVNYDDL